MLNVLRFREEGDVVVVDVGGDLTNGRDSIPLRALLQELEEAGYVNILVNMGGVTSIDGDSIAQLAACHRSLARVNGALKLLNPQESVKSVLRATRLDSVFETYEVENEAILSFYWADVHQIQEILRVHPREVHRG